MDVSSVGGGDSQSMTTPDAGADEPADSGDSVGASGDGGDTGAVGGTGDAGDAGDAGSTDDSSSSSSSSGPTEVQRQLAQDSFEPSSGSSSDQSGSSASQTDAQQGGVGGTNAQKADAQRTDAQQADARRSDTQQADARREDIRQSQQKGDAVRMDARRDTFEAAPRRSPPTTAPQQQAQAPRTPAAPQQQRQQFQANVTQENRAHLARQRGEISQKWNEFTGWMGRQGDWARRNIPGARQVGDAASAVGNFAADKAKQAAHATGLDQVRVPESVKNVADAVTKPILSNSTVMNGAATAERFGYGVGMEALGMAEGLHHMATTNPFETLGNLGKAAWNYDKTGAAIGKAISDSWNKDPVETLGRGAFEIGSFLVPGGQAKGAATAVEAADHVGQVARLAHGVEELGQGARVANGLEHAGQAGEIAQGLERTAQAGELARGAGAAEDLARTGRTAEQLTRPAAEAAETAGAAAKAEQAAPKLTHGSEEYNALQKSVEAKEELARRLRDTVGGRHETLPGGRGHAMSGATGSSSPGQLLGQASRLEAQAAEGRQLLQAADRTAEAGAGAGTAAKAEEAAQAGAGTAKAEEAAKMGNEVVRRVREARMAEEAARAAPRAEEAAGAAAKAEEAAGPASSAWKTNPKELQHKRIPGETPTRGMANGNGTSRYQWMGKAEQEAAEAAAQATVKAEEAAQAATKAEEAVQAAAKAQGTPEAAAKAEEAAQAVAKAEEAAQEAAKAQEVAQAAAKAEEAPPVLLQQSAVKKDGSVAWGQTERVVKGGPPRPAYTPNPINGAPKGNEIRGHFTPYEATKMASQSGANMGKQNVIMNHTHPYITREAQAVEHMAQNPGAKYLVLSKVKDGVEYARRQILFEPRPDGRGFKKIFDEVANAVHDPEHNLEKALAAKRAPKPPKTPPAPPAVPPTPTP